LLHQVGISFYFMYT